MLFVFLVALAEATSWYAAYQTINLTGQPYCCPFPTTVVASLVLQVRKATRMCRMFRITSPSVHLLSAVTFELRYDMTATLPRHCSDTTSAAGEWSAPHDLDTAC